MKRIIAATLMILVAFFLQTAFFTGDISKLPVPNLLLIITVSFGFIRGTRTGLITGLVCGLLADVFFSDFIGLNALLYMSVGFMNGVFNKIFFGEEIRLPVLLVFGSDIAYNVALYIFMFLFRGRLDFFYYLIHIILPEAIFTAIIAFIVYKPILMLHEKFTEAEKEREQ
ncbi:rod shape-determining protein MreD [Parasporobacterium paucivorans]|nr:rod shape-determining protein MreD [Parasporobacterium paucivorans]